MPTREQKRQYNSTPAAKASRAAYKKRNPLDRSEESVEQRRWYTLRWRTGWTREMCGDAREAQGHRCAICPRWLAEGYVHDHTERDGVKIPRAVLCMACNLSLGWYEKKQRPAGLVIDVYERYIARW